MITLMIIHEVDDYTNWKTVFDDAATIRREAGETEYRLYAYHNQPNKVIHLSVWVSMAAAEAFFHSPRLVKLRQEAGVHQPEFIYLHPLEAAVL